MPAAKADDFHQLVWFIRERTDLSMTAKLVHAALMALSRRHHESEFSTTISEICLLVPGASSTAVAGGLKDLEAIGAVYRTPRQGYASLYRLPCDARGFVTLSPPENVGGVAKKTVPSPPENVGGVAKKTVPSPPENVGGVALIGTRASEESGREIQNPEENTTPLPPQPTSGEVVVVEARRLEDSAMRPEGTSIEARKAVFDLIERTVVECFEEENRGYAEHIYQKAGQYIGKLPIEDFQYACDEAWSRKVELRGWPSYVASILARRASEAKTVLPREGGPPSRGSQYKPVLLKPHPTLSELREEEATRRASLTQEERDQEDRKKAAWAAEWKRSQSKQRGDYR